MGLCKRNTSHRRAKAVPEELFPDAAAAFVGDRFLDSLRSLEMTKRRLRLVEMTGESSLEMTEKGILAISGLFFAILTILEPF